MLAQDSATSTKVAYSKIPLKNPTDDRTSMTVTHVPSLIEINFCGSLILTETDLHVTE